jgi:hypothetical protein
MIILVLVKMSVKKERKKSPTHFFRIEMRIFEFWYFFYRHSFIFTTTPRFTKIAVLFPDLRDFV